MALTMDTGIIVFFPVFCLTGAKKKEFEGMIHNSSLGA
jgi:hypothetical protein